MKKQEYQQGQSDHIMFFHRTRNGRKVVLIVYFDDIILTGDDSCEIEKLKKTMSIEFKVKNLDK